LAAYGLDGYAVGFPGRGRASLDDIATLLGFPGKVGMHGSEVWEVYLQGGLAKIRDYCETDVLNTYLISCASNCCAAI
jgi:predicted PolB exonuclease-like 3'-5' exonuclease